MLPTQIDRYQIIEECGRGGMAIVYRAYDTQRQMEVALKVLPQEYLHDEQFRKRFKREIDINIAFRHEAVIPIYGYGQFQGQLYLVMRYLPGGSLEDYLKQSQTQSIEETLRMVTRIAPALDAAHQQGIIHRDLKTSNILFDEQRQAYVADFGIARLAEQASFTMLSANSVIGSPAYMSPEQARSGTEIDGRSDLYSLGVVVFEALTGQLPFYDSNPMTLAVMQMHNPIPNILSFNPNLPSAMRDYMYTALAKNPDERFQTAVEMSQALRELFQQSGRPSSSPRMRAQAPGSPAPRPHSSEAAPQASPAPQPGQRAAPQVVPRPPSISPRALPASARPAARYLQLPPSLRVPALSHVTLPRFLHPVTRFLGMPSTFNLPPSWRKYVLIAMGIGFVLFLVFGACVGIFYLLFRLGIFPLVIKNPFESSLPLIHAIFFA